MKPLCLSLSLDAHNKRRACSDDDSQGVREMSWNHVDICGQRCQTLESMMLRMKVTSVWWCEQCFDGMSADGSMSYACLGMVLSMTARWSVA
jgi:hypothetical protein